MTEIKIELTRRWTRERDARGDFDWVQIECFKFTEADGRESFADGLFPEQSEIFQRQEAERAAAKAQEAA